MIRCIAGVILFFVAINSYAQEQLLKVGEQITKGEEKLFRVEVSGQGQPMLLIPGLVSSGEVWDETVEKFKQDFQTHTFTLAGFAGVPAPEDPSLEKVKSGIVRYIRDNNLQKPVIVGHSLGGFLALWAASENPDLFSSLIIVDSLPFLAQAINPAITPEGAKAVARQMKQRTLVQTTPEQRRLYQLQTLQGMISDKKEIERVLAWSLASDPAMIAQSLYDLYATDLRDAVARIKAPTLVFGSWIAAKDYGLTKEYAQAQYEEQYQVMPQAEIQISESGRHFIMLDDPIWFWQKMAEFLASARP